MRDLVVVGGGGMGSAAMYFASQLGWDVLGLDRYPPGHARGSSHGHVRIYRHAYFEHPNYVPMALEASRLWREIAESTGVELIRETGLLQTGPREGQVVEGVLRSAREHGLEIEFLESEALTEAFPQFRFDDGTVGVVERAAGVLFVEDCVRSLIQAAGDAGADWQNGVEVLGWRTDAGGTWVVETDRGEFRTRRLVVTPGAWAGPLLGERMAGRLRVVARHQYWFESQQAVASGCYPTLTWLCETAGGCYYGFPVLDGQRFKVAEHTTVGERVVPGVASRELDPHDLERIAGFVGKYLQLPDAVHVDHSVCFYTLSPDGHFIVDRLGESGTAVFACGFSGHGFKFAPVIGQVLVEMLQGRDPAETAFLRLGRFGESL